MNAHDSAPVPQGGVDSAAFRRALAQLAGGVVVVTSVDSGGRPSGVTATAVCSVSLEPPLVLVCLGAKSRTRETIAKSGRYAINVLASGHRLHAERFAAAGDGKFDGLIWEPGRSGCPVLPDSIAVCECDVEKTIEAGDHTVFVGRVAEVRATDSAQNRPLLWFRGRYARLSAEDVE